MDGSAARDQRVGDLVALARAQFDDRHVAAALEGQGIVQQLDLLVSGYLSEGRLVEVLRDHSCEGPPLSVIYQRAAQNLAKVRVFAEFAADLMKQYEARMRRNAEPRDLNAISSS